MKQILFSTLVFTSLAISSCKTNNANDVKLSDKTVDSLLVSHPDSIPFLLYKAEMLSKDYKFYESLEFSAKAFRLDSSNVQTRFFYANALNNREGRTIQDVANAQRHYLYIISKNPKDYKAMVDLATTYGFMQDYETAFDYLNKAIRINDKYAEAYVYKGTVYRTIGKMDLAKSSYETAIQMNPDYYEAYLFLATIYESEKNPIALEYYKTAYELTKNPEILYAYAFANDQFNKIDVAKTNYRLLASDKNKFYASVGKFHLGYIKQIKEMEIDSAMYFYSQAIDLNNDYIEAFHNRAMCYEIKKDYVSARTDYLSALQIDPEFDLSIKAFQKIEKK